MKKRPKFRKEKAFLCIRDTNGTRIFESKGEIEDVLSKANQKFGYSGFHKLYDNIDAFGKKIKKIKKK